MTDALKALADKVEAGTLTYDDCLKLCDTFKGYHGRAFEAFEGSLDAAKALMDAVLPGWDIQITTHDDDNFEAAVAHPLRVKTYDGISATMARAWLLAILRALQSEG